MKLLWQTSDFVRKMRREMRFGELSRAPIHLLRFQLLSGEVECDWVSRSADPWDSDLHPRIGEKNQTSQALKDAMIVRELLFTSLPEICAARLRVYRRTEEGSRELIIAGTVTREDDAPQGIRSIAMRAKLCGLRFWLNNGVLGVLQSGECVMSV